MPQITIYLDDEIAELIDKAVQSAGVSKSRWIADAVRARVNRRENHRLTSIGTLAEQRKPDFPTREAIRKQSGHDSPREKL